MVKEKEMAIRRQIFAETGKCPCCDNPDSSRHQRYHCHKSGCKAEFKARGHPAKKVEAKKETRRARNKRYVDNKKMS